MLMVRSMNDCNTLLCLCVYTDTGFHQHTEMQWENPYMTITTLFFFLQGFQQQVTSIYVIN